MTMIEPILQNDGATLYLGDCIDVMKSMQADSVDLVFGSPPYCDARTYGIGAQRDCIEWVEWMLDVTEAAARVCRGPVFWVAAGVTRKRNYWPAVEGLMWEWWKRGGTHELYRPCVFHRVGIPGSGGKDYFRADWEYVICFKKPGILAWSDNTACGHPPKYAPGGEMSNRLSNGSRVNHWGHSFDSISCNSVDKNGKRTKKNPPSHKLQTRRKANGKRPGRKVITIPRDGMHNQEQDYTEPVLANPGNVFKIIVGGGVMGHKLMHENEAPFPEKLVEIFVKSFCPPGGIILDPFMGSGTTAVVALRNGRKTIGIDIRDSQIELQKKRLFNDTPLLNAQGNE